MHAVHAADTSYSPLYTDTDNEYTFPGHDSEGAGPPSRPRRLCGCGRTARRCSRLRRWARRHPYATAICVVVLAAWVVLVWEAAHLRVPIVCFFNPTYCARVERLAAERREGDAASAGRPANATRPPSPPPEDAPPPPSRMVTVLDANFVPMFIGGVTAAALVTCTFVVVQPCPPCCCQRWCGCGPGKRQRERPPPYMAADCEDADWLRHKDGEPQLGDATYEVAGEGSVPWFGPHNPRSGPTSEALPGQLRDAQRTLGATAPYDDVGGSERGYASAPEGRSGFVRLTRVREPTAGPSLSDSSSLADASPAAPPART